MDFDKSRTTGVFVDILNAMDTKAGVCYNLQFDGKLLKQGLTEYHGDIDCLGEEDPPTLRERIQIHVHHEELALVQHMHDIILAASSQSFNGEVPLPMVPPMRDALQSWHVLINKLKDLRYLKQQKLRAIEKFKKKGVDNSKYTFVIDSCKTAMHITEGTIKQCIEEIAVICNLGADLNGAGEL